MEKKEFFFIDYANGCKKRGSITLHLEAVYHRPTDNYAYIYDSRAVHLRLRAKKGDITRCSVLYADKYQWAENQELVPMSLLGSDQLFDYWQCEVTPPFRRLAYVFLLEKGKRKMWYAEGGFFQRLPREYQIVHPFEVPFVHEVDTFSPPAWVKDAVFYQIFPERFANGDPANDPEKVEVWGNKPTPQSFFGGDLQGVIDHLDHLTSLGVNAIYFTPVFEAPSNHKYDTVDYLKVDPHFGDLATLKRLVQTCHERGIRVMLDAVFNHAGFHFQPFQDVLARGHESPFVDWFHVRSFPLITNPPNYDTFGFVAEMPKLNTANPEVKEYLLKVARYWIEEVGIDGWRLDVANEVDHEFWREFRREVKKIQPDTYILGEIWHEAMPWLRGDQFDAVMNYPFTDAVLGFMAKESMAAAEFAARIIRNLVAYPQQVNQVMFNLLDSHDTARLLRKCGERKEKVKLAAALQLTFPGAPCVYYGDEVGMSGGEDPDCRQTMEWDPEKQDQELLGFYRRLIALRKEHPALRAGTLRFLLAEANQKQLAYLRESAGEKILIAINVSEEEAQISLPVTAPGYQTLGNWGLVEINNGVNVTTDQLRIKLGAYGLVILKLAECAHN